jgi:hypothetical protein
MITIPVNINQKILTINISYNIENNNTYVFEISKTNNNPYLIDKIREYILLPCCNTFFCLNYLKINIIDIQDIKLSLILNIFEYDNKKYIVSDYFFYLISFSDVNYELNFYTNIITQLNKDKNNTISNDLKLITWKELNDDNFLDHFCIYLKNYKPINETQNNIFTINYTLFFLYINPIYNNKNLKKLKHNNFPKKIILNANLIKKEEFSFLESDNFSLEEHYTFIKNDKYIYKYICNKNYFLIKNNKFKKVNLLKIKGNTINCIMDTYELEINDVILSLYPIINTIITWEKLISFYTLKILNTKNTEDNCIETLINNYNFPLRYDKKKLDNTFEKIMIYFLTNFETTFLLGKNNDISNIINIDEKDKIIFKEDIEKLLNTKSKTKLSILLTNILKILYNSKNNNYDKIIFNSKIYNESILFEVLKNLLENNELYILYPNIIKTFNFIPLKKYFTNIIIIKQILKNINWKNISYNLKQLKFLIDNTQLLYFKGRYNKNVFPINFDTNIKKIIKEPLEMFKYLRSEKDFIRWIYFVDNINILNNIYFNNIIINSDDFEILGELLYRFSILKDQNLKNNEYLYLLQICKKNKHLILYNNRINLKLKEYFVKSNILNLGFLAKHLNWDKDIQVSLDEMNNISIEELQKQFIIINKKYNKYKGKYIKLKTTTETNNV